MRAIERRPATSINKQTNGLKELLKKTLQGKSLKEIAKPKKIQKDTSSLMDVKSPTKQKEEKVFDIQIAADKIAQEAWNKTEDTSHSVSKNSRREDPDPEPPGTWTCPSFPPNCDATGSGCTKQNCGSDPLRTC